MRYGFAAGDWWPWWMAFMLQNGGRIVDDAGKPVINSPQNVKAMQFYVDLVAKHKVAPSKRDYESLKISSPDQLFAQGNAAMVMTGFWNVAALKEVPHVRWGVAPLFQNTKQATISFQTGLRDHQGEQEPGPRVQGPRLPDQRRWAEADRRQRPGRAGEPGGAGQRSVPAPGVGHRRRRHDRFQDSPRSSPTRHR